MEFNFDSFEKKLTEALRIFDTKAVTGFCNIFIRVLTESDLQLPAKKNEWVLQALRNKRMFLQMQQVAECYIQTGRVTYKIRRQYAQSLIDLGIYAAALAILTELRNDTAGDTTPGAVGENKEAIGLIGRVYKQLYVNAGKVHHPMFDQSLKLSADNYYAVYSLNRANTWQGINLVALLKRAEADNVGMTGFPNANEVAKQILEIIEDKDVEKSADTWDYATAMEACIALNRMEDAVTWAGKYVNASYTDAFEIGSTLRQLKEVWQLDVNIDPGKQVLQVLSAALLMREGGNVVLQAADVQEQEKVNPKYVKKLEKVFGDDSFKTYQWYTNGLKRCAPVARIGKDSSKGFGTGFLIKGDHLHKKLKGELVLLTNAHVVSDDPASNFNSLTPKQANVIFETINQATVLSVSKIFCSSSVNELDFSVLQFDEANQKKLKKLVKDIELYEVCEQLPATDGKQRVYIIGHPAGGTLQISLQDNVFLDYKDPFMHYRTPTEGGSSGSPVFNDNWELIGLHHAGDEKMQKLDGSDKTYEANEGISMKSIIKEIKKILK